MGVTDGDASIPVPPVRDERSEFCTKEESLVIEFDLVRISKPGISLISLACPDSVARSPDWSLILRSGFRFKIDSTAAVVQVRSAHVH